MANILRCDRCGKEFKNLFEQTFSIAKRRWFDNDSVWRPKNYDLCPDCTKAFEKEFMGKAMPTDRGEDVILGR